MSLYHCGTLSVAAQNCQLDVSNSLPHPSLSMFLPSFFNIL
uniref:Uncharacterized protein n=1 Tax=Anguilla anguilla TaxID=7936 RepID=A0A0E9XCD3_ANGAN